MGFAKYYEDNARITDDRRFYYDHWATKGYRKSIINDTVKTKTVITSTLTITDGNPWKSDRTESKQISNKERSPLKRKLLECKDCGCGFEYSVGEQKFFLKKGWKEPVRCPQCRKETAILRSMRGWN